MNWIKKISCFLIVLSALSFSGGDAYAQNVFKLDFFKTPGKFATWVQKQAENFENAMKEIGESQFATFIGKGIESAKKGIQFAKDKLNETKNLFKKVKDGINAVKQSTEYKIAMLSSLSASETTVLNDMKKQRDTEKAAKKSEYEISRVALEEKIKIAKENFEVGIEVLESEVAELKSEEERDVKRKEIDAFRTSNRDAIASMEGELALLEEKNKEDIKAIENDFAASIVAQTTIIANIGMEIAELVEQKKREKGEKTKDPDKAVEEAVSDFSYKEDEVVTLEVRQKKEKTRKRKRERASISASGYSTGIIAKTEEKKEEEQQNSAISETLNGKSESLQTAILQTVVQMDSLYEYLILELKAIELETASIMSDNKEYRAGDVKASVNVCDYEIDKTSFLDAIKKGKDMIDGAVDKAKGAVDKAKGAIDKAKGAVDTAKGVVDAVSENPADAISGLTGM